MSILSCLVLGFIKGNKAIISCTSRRASKLQKALIKTLVYPLSTAAHPVQGRGWVGSFPGLSRRSSVVFLDGLLLRCVFLVISKPFSLQKFPCHWVLSLFQIQGQTSGTMRTNWHWTWPPTRSAPLFSRGNSKAVSSAATRGQHYRVCLCCKLSKSTLNLVVFFPVYEFHQTTISYHL